MITATIPKTQRWPIIIVILGMVVFAGYFSWLSVLKADVFDTHSSDLSYMWQAMWNVVHGHGFVLTWDYALNVHRLSIHADYLLVLLAPLTWIWPNPHSLLIVQAVAVAAGAWFIFQLTRLWLHRPWLSAVMALCYLWYGPLQFAVVWQFHAETVATTFMLAAVEAVARRRRQWVFWVWFWLALISKEHVGLILGPMVWLIARGTDRRLWAWWPLAVGWSYSLIHFFMIIPSFVPTTITYHGLAYFQSYLTGYPSPVTILKNIFDHLTRGLVGSSVIGLLLPTGGLGLWHPLTLVAAMAMLPHWLADESSKQMLIYHNQALAIPALWLGIILGVQKIFQRWPAVTDRRLAGWLIGASLVGTVVLSPNPWSFKFHPAYLIRNPNLDKIPAMKKVLPQNASVSYSKQAGAHFRNRVIAQELPYGVTSVAYVILVDGPSELPDRSMQADYNFFAAYLARSVAFRPVYDDGHNFIYQRDFAISPEPIPDEFTAQALGEIRT